MKQYVLVAGVDYEFKGVDFRVLTENRRKRLVNANTAKQDLRFTTIDFRAGEIAVVDVTYPGGKRKDGTASTKPFTPIGASSYTKTTNPDGSTHTRFKPGQPTAASIINVYQVIRDIGTNDPGSLAELSFFSHGWMGGPILVDSDDNRTITVTAIPPLGPPITATRPLSATARNPDDKDPRAQYDFVAPTMDGAALKLFQTAFASDGIIWLWGCAFPHVVHHTLWAIENSSAYRSSGQGNDDVLVLDKVVKEDVDYLEFHLQPLLGSFPSRSTVTIKFKHLKHFVCLANQSAFASQIATAAKVNCLAAPLGTYADYDSSGPLPLMSVFSKFGPHFTFYKNYMGMTYDPEGRHYGVYKPGLSCPVP